MRILLLTDSLGCPRKETAVEKTWTEKIMCSMKKKSYSLIFYTYCMYGLSSRDIIVEYINRLEPDIIVCQIGIVDACRRAMSRREESILSKIPFISRIVNKICRTYHYTFTKLRNIHYGSLTVFRNLMEKVIEGTEAQIFFIEIAPPGKYLREHVYRVEEDICEYNREIEKLQNDKLKILKPYERYSPDLFLLEDGHHLNPFGIELVYQQVSSAVGSYIENSLWAKEEN